MLRRIEAIYTADRHQLCSFFLGLGNANDHTAVSSAVAVELSSTCPWMHIQALTDTNVTGMTAEVELCRRQERPVGFGCSWWWRLPCLPTPEAAWPAVPPIKNEKTIGGTAPAVAPCLRDLAPRTSHRATTFFLYCLRRAGRRQMPEATGHTACFAGVAAVLLPYSRHFTLYQRRDEGRSTRSRPDLYLARGL